MDTARATRRNAPRHVGYSYGLSREQVDELVQRAEGRCEGCGVATVELVFDHCHSDGLVRGLICYPCNNTLGAARDNAARLRGLADYLEREAMVPEKPVRERAGISKPGALVEYRRGMPIPIEERMAKARRARKEARVKATPAS